jgi:hypothetical protein
MTITGARAQAPRQLTVSTVNLRSSVSGRGRRPQLLFQDVNQSGAAFQVTGGSQTDLDLMFSTRLQAE